MRMKHRWTGALLVVAALSLGACAPAQSGTDGSGPAEPDPTAAPASSGAATASPTAEASGSPSESATSAPTPEVDYEY